MDLELRVVSMTTGATTGRKNVLPPQKNSTINKLHHTAQEPDKTKKLGVADLVLYLIY